MTLSSLLVTGILYPLAITAVAHLAFPQAAGGSLVHDERGAVVGSELIGQPFAKPWYFQGRPSAAGNGYDATQSSGSNFGATSKKLRERATADLQRLQKENPGAGAVPLSLLAASASGLDPHLSPDAVLYQVQRVAKARGLSEQRVRTLVSAAVEGPDLGFLGEPRVNVLLLNLALDRQFGPPAPSPAPSLSSGH